MAKRKQRKKQVPKGPPVLPGEFTADENAGALTTRIPTRKYRSSRTGRMVAMSTAMEDYRQSRDSVPVRSEAMHGGFWDHERDSPRMGPPRPAREDVDAMAAFVRQHSAKLTARQLDVYHLFWVRFLSREEVARETGTSASKVYACIKRLRIKLAKHERGTPGYPPGSSR